MRIGHNPERHKDTEVSYSHKVVMPVYIPHLNDYFAEALDVLRVSLESLRNTIHAATTITVVANACCPEVRQELVGCSNRGEIQQLVLNEDNLGKVDSIMNVVRGSYEPLITLTDCDVLFEPNWQSIVETVFQGFPQAGMVSPCPIPALLNAYNLNTIVFGITRFKLEVGDYLPADQLVLFTRSIGNDFYKNKSALLRKQFALTNNDVRAILGAGHFVATFRREIFRFSPDKPSNKKVSGRSEYKYLDMPVERAGLLRLATHRIAAHHMGNKLESWHTEVLDRTRRCQPTKPLTVPRIPRRSLSRWLPKSMRHALLHYVIGPLLIRRITRQVSNSSSLEPQIVDKPIDRTQSPVAVDTSESL
jgi:hypothetical protein